MNFVNRKYVRSVFVLVLALIAASVVSAQCALPSKLAKPATWNPLINRAHLLRAALSDDRDNDDNAPSIVGMWHVIFTAQAINGELANIPLDNAIVVWHPDGTEIMNSNRPAQDGNFCLGVWKRTGKRSYYLNHIPWAGNDPSNAPSGIGNPQAGVQLIEQVNLSPDGDSYSGQFSLQAYDQNNHPSVLFTGVLTATRIRPDTSITSLF
jgi:hypothetical protein